MEMRTLLFSLLSLSFTYRSGHAQFMDGSRFDCGGYYMDNADELLKDTLVREISIFPLLFKYSEQLDNPPVYNEPGCLSFHFSLDPESTDEEKQEFIEALKQGIDRLSFLLKSSKLKKVHFQIGEQIFMSAGEVKKCNGNHKKMAKVNLDNAWNVLGKDLQAQYPHIKFYAGNWGW